MNFIYLLIALSVCVSIHEASHAFIALKLGDDTAQKEGRVSLNPLVHLDLLGTIMIFFINFGWGKPVPFNYNKLKNPRIDSALIAIAGPISNLLTALVISVIIKYIDINNIFLSNSLYKILNLSIILFIFNLIPIAPLDGSKILALLIPKKYSYYYHRFVDTGPMYLILLVMADKLFQGVLHFSFLGYLIEKSYDLVLSILFFSS